MEYQGFLGGYGVERGPNVNLERTINWIPCPVDAGTPSSRVALYRTPGLKATWAFTDRPIRALFEENGRVFCVAGASLYELHDNGTSTFRGSIAEDDRNASISSNYIATPDDDEETPNGGNQLFIVSGGEGYIFDLIENTLEHILDDGFPDNAVTGLFFDGYFIVLSGNTGQFNLSELGNGLEWNGLDFGLESQVADQTRAMVRTHDNLWLFGNKHTSPWYNSGNASFPFQPVQGTLIEHGIEARDTIQAMDNTLIWLGRDSQGGRVVWRAEGYTPQKISTFAIDTYLAKLNRVDDGIAWSYLEEGHLFYVLYLPASQTTLVYDVSTRLWHERAMLVSDASEPWVWEPHLARCHCYGFGKHLVGDRSSGTVYEQSLSYLDDSLTLGV